MERALGIKVNVAERTTNARVTATKDIFNYITYLVMNNSTFNRLCVKDVLIGNWDGTSCSVGGSRICTQTEKVT